MTTPSDLAPMDTVSTDELIEELRKRMGSILVIGTRGDGLAHLVSAGTLIEQCGLLYVLNQTLGMRLDERCHSLANIGVPGEEAGEEEPSEEEDDEDE